MGITSPFQIPGYLEALEHERVHRVIAFHSPAEKIAGFEVTAMTLRQWSLLRLVDSPFLPPFNTPAPQQLIQFLWIMSPHFTADETPAKAAFFARARQLFIPPAPPRWRIHFLLKRWYFKRKECEIQQAAALQQARKFVERTFMDRPLPGDGGSPDYYSDECTIAGMLSEAYGWDQEKVMEMSLVLIFQHMRRIREVFQAENGLPCSLSNPSDEAIQEYLQTVNSKN